MAEDSVKSDGIKARAKVMLLGPDGQLGRTVRSETMTGLELVPVPRGALDLTDQAAIRRAVDELRPDLILNAAAFTDVDRAEVDQDEALAVNARAVETLARSAKDVGAAFLHISTDQVFDGGLDRAYTETDHAAPLNMYGATKLLGEELAQLACPRTAILRTSNLHAPWGQNAVRAAIVADDQPDALTAAADRQMSPTSAAFLSQVCLVIAPALIQADAYGDCWGVTHCAGLGAASEADLLRHALVLAGKGKDTVQAARQGDWPAAAARPRSTPLDCARLTRVFGIQATTWQAQLAATVSALTPKRTHEAA